MRSSVRIIGVIFVVVGSECTFTKAVAARRSDTETKCMMYEVMKLWEGRLINGGWRSGAVGEDVVGSYWKGIFERE